MGPRSALILALVVSCGDDAAPPPRADGGAPAPAFDAGPGAPAPSWSVRRALPLPQQETAVVALGDKVYVIGGLTTGGRALADVNVYDPAADTWSPARALPEPLHHVNAAAVGGRIWIAGALRGGDFAAVGSVLVYDPQTNEWTPKTPMKAGSERGSSFTAAIDDYVYVGGGLRGGSVADFARYDTANDVWEDLPPMPVALDHGAGAAHDGTFLAFGGRSSGLQARVDAFDPASRTWSSRAPMPTPRAGFALAVLGGRAIVFGGEGNPSSPIGMFAEVEAYDLAGDAWSKLPPMRTPRHGMGAAAIGPEAIVPGGGTEQGLAPTDVVETFRL